MEDGVAVAVVAGAGGEEAGMSDAGMGGVLVGGATAISPSLPEWYLVHPTPLPVFFICMHLML